MSTPTARSASAIALALATLGAFANATAASESASTTPRVSGPVVGGARGVAFAAPTVDLQKLGYVAEEFFLEGTAHAFEFAPGSEPTADGKWKVQRSAQSAPYKTRILVVRPQSAAQFNGTVIVHWQNVTAGYELGTVTEGEYLRGFAWVGVSAQKVGIDGFPGPDAAGLRQWDPERYGSLHHPGDDFSYDIYTQAARVVSAQRSRASIDPMGGLPVRRLIAAGASQSAARLRAYINGIHPLEHTFDGYIPYIDFARPAPFSSTGTASNAQSPMFARSTTLIREDLDVPVFVVNSETETESYFPARQADTKRFRFWEVAGTSHVNVPRALAADPDAELRPGMKIGDLHAPNWLSYRAVYDAAIHHMHAWLIDGREPPRAAPIDMITTKPSATIRRDARGNALGGIRLPEFAVASAEHRGSGTNKPGGYRLGFLYGFAREFTPAELQGLYASSAAFMAEYDKALQDVVKDGFVLPEDAPAMRRAAFEWARRLDRE